MKRVSLILCVLLLSLLVLVSCDSLGGKTEQTEPSATETPTEQVTQPEVTEPEVTEPEVTEPEVTEPEVTEPEVTEPEATEPEVTEPEVTEPEATEPEVTKPEATEPEVTEPEVTEPEVTEPGVQIPDTPPADEIPAWKDLTFQWYTVDMDEDGVLDMALYGYSPDGTVEGLVEDEEAIILSTVAYTYDNKGNLISEMVNEMLYDEKGEQVAVASYAIDWEGIYEMQYMAYSGETPLGGWMAEKVTVDGETALMVTVQLLSFHTVEHELLGTFYAPAEEIVIVYDESFENGYQAEKYVYDNEGNEIRCDEIEIDLRDMVCGESAPMYRDTIDETIQPQKPVKPDESESDDEDYEEKTEYDEEGRPVKVQAYENGELVSETTFTYMNGMLFQEFTVYYEEGISYMTDTTHYFYDKAGEVVDVDYVVNVPGEECRTEYRYDKESGLLVARELFFGEELVESTLFEYDGSLLMRIEVVEYTAEGEKEVIDSIDYFYDEEGSYIGNSTEDTGNEELPEDTKPGEPPVDDPDVTEPEETKTEDTKPSAPPADDPDVTEPTEDTEPEEFVDGWYDILNEKGDQTARRYYENGILYYEETHTPGFGISLISWYDAEGKCVYSFKVPENSELISGNPEFIREILCIDSMGNIRMKVSFELQEPLLTKVIQMWYRNGASTGGVTSVFGYDENGKLIYTGDGDIFWDPEETEPEETEPIETAPGIELPEDTIDRPVVTEPTEDTEPEEFVDGWYDILNEKGDQTARRYYENGILYYEEFFRPGYGMDSVQWYDVTGEAVVSLPIKTGMKVVHGDSGFIAERTVVDQNGNITMYGQFVTEGCFLYQIIETVYEDGELNHYWYYDYGYDENGKMNYRNIYQEFPENDDSDVGSDTEKPEVTEPTEETNPGIELPEDTIDRPVVTEPTEDTESEGSEPSDDVKNGWCDESSEDGFRYEGYYENGRLYYRRVYHPRYGLYKFEWFDADRQLVYEMEYEASAFEIEVYDGFLIVATALSDGEMDVRWRYFYDGVRLGSVEEEVYGSENKLLYTVRYTYIYDDAGIMIDMEETKIPGEGSEPEDPEVSEDTYPIVTEPEGSEPEEPEVLNGWYEEYDGEVLRYRAFYVNGSRVYHESYDVEVEGAPLQYVGWRDLAEDMALGLSFPMFNDIETIMREGGFITCVATVGSDDVSKYEAFFEYNEDGTLATYTSREFHGTYDPTSQTINYYFYRNGILSKVITEEAKPEESESEVTEPVETEPEDTWEDIETKPVESEPEVIEPEVTEPEGEIREGWHEGYVDGLYVRTYYENGKALYRETTDPDGNSGDKHIHIVEWMDRAENPVLTVVLPMFSADEFLQYEGGMLSMIAYATSDGRLKCEEFFEYEYGLLKTFTQRTFSGTYYPTEERIETFIYKDGIISGSEISEPDATGPAVTEPVETEPEDTREDIETKPVESEPEVIEPDAPVESEDIGEEIETKPVETEPVETEPVESESEIPEDTESDGLRVHEYSTDDAVCREAYVNGHRIYREICYTEEYYASTGIASVIEWFDLAGNFVTTTPCPIFGDISHERTKYDDSYNLFIESSIYRNVSDDRMTVVEGTATFEYEGFLLIRFSSVTTKRNPDTSVTTSKTYEFIYENGILIDTIEIDGSESEDTEPDNPVESEDTWEETESKPVESEPEVIEPDAPVESEDIGEEIETKPVESDPEVIEPDAPVEPEDSESEEILDGWYEYGDADGEYKIVYYENGTIYYSEYYRGDGAVEFLWYDAAENVVLRHGLFVESWDFTRENGFLKEAFSDGINDQRSFEYDGAILISYTSERKLDPEGCVIQKYTYVYKDGILVDVIESDGSEPEVTEPEETEPDAPVESEDIGEEIETKPVESEPEVIEPEDTWEEIETKPAESEPEVIEPEDTWEENETKPAESEPEVIEPDAPVEPEDSEFVETEPGIELPEDPLDKPVDTENPVDTEESVVTEPEESDASTNLEELPDDTETMPEDGVITEDGIVSA